MSKSYGVAAAVHYVGLVDAIRALAETTLDLDLQDPSDYELASLLAAVFLYCYFTDYVDHINLWREAHDEDPFVLNVSLLGQVMGYFETLFGKIGSFFKGMTSKSSSVDEELAALNPLTYRGYLWDEDVGMYYLKSRFYQPQVGRFLNADSVFDTKTGVLGTNMFAYCDNNPVNRLDSGGLWSSNVHYGANVIQYDLTEIVSVSEYNGTKYGTLQWAMDIGFNEQKAEEIAYGDNYMEDVLIRIIGWAEALFSWNSDIFWEIQSWHGNQNLFKSMGMILPETTELRTLETLISLDNYIYYIDNFSLADWVATDYKKKDKFRVTLGISLHPVQDKHGHPEYWAVDLSLLHLPVSVFTFLFKNSLSEGNEIDNFFVLHGVKYYQWENVIRSRDETYNVLGRWKYHIDHPA